ncbi:MAG: hypothetical protein ABUK01_14305 [Leptospirales bacterium]
MMYKTFLLLFVCISVQFCAATQTTDTNTPKVVKSTDETELIENLRLTYPSHQALTASFKLRAFQKGKKVYLIGKLKTGFDNEDRIISIKLYDAVFSSLIYSLDINGAEVKTFNHMKRRSETVPLEDFYLVELFGAYFPFKFLVPFMYGSIPEVIYLKNTAIDTEKGFIDYVGDTYHLRTHITQNAVDKLEYKDFYTGAITYITFTGKLKNPKAYHFPKSIKVTNSKSEEYVSIDFTQVKFLEE